MSLRITELTQHIGGHVNFPFKWENVVCVWGGGGVYHSDKLFRTSSSLMYSNAMAQTQLVATTPQSAAQNSAALLIISVHLAIQFETVWLCNHLWEALKSNKEQFGI